MASFQLTRAVRLLKWPYGITCSLALAFVCPSLFFRVTNQYLRCPLDGMIFRLNGYQTKWHFNERLFRRNILWTK